MSQVKIKLTSTLFPPGTFILWHRSTRRCKWRVVGGATTGAKALAMQDSSGIKNGEWIVKDDGRDPNEKPAR